MTDFTRVDQADRVVMTNAAEVTVETRVNEDDHARFTQDVDGKQQWGSGAAAPDTNLYRSAASLLKTDDVLQAALGIIPGAGWALKVEEIDFGADELGGSETNTSFSFTAGSILLYAFIDVDDEEAGGSMDVGTQGTSNDPDGILDGISLATAGVVTPDHTITTGSNESYISATTFGALWSSIQLGTDVAGDTGFVTIRPKVIAAADPVSITASGDLDSCSGKLYLVVLEPAT